MIIARLSEENKLWAESKPNWDRLRSKIRSAVEAGDPEAKIKPDVNIGLTLCLLMGMHEVTNFEGNFESCVFNKTVFSIVLKILHERPLGYVNERHAVAANRILELGGFDKRIAMIPTVFKVVQPAN